MRRRAAIFWAFLLANVLVLNVTASQAVAEEHDVEKVVRDYYRHLKLYDYEAMRAMSTAGFEITYSGLQLDRDEFEARHREEERVRGPTDSRPERLLYELSNFRTEVDVDLAFVTCMEINPGGNSYFNLLVLRRLKGQWLLHRFFHVLTETSTVPPVQPQ